MDANSVWLGDRQQGNHAKRLQGNKGIVGMSPEVVGPRGRYLTGLVEPCGACPRLIYLFIRSSFIYLSIYLFIYLFCSQFIKELVLVFRSRLASSPTD
jgi:hypothetical protein